ncbi:NfeD family protein [Parahaliea maris]|nr:nodulation protein NfeD [Parahaliea maris]
MTWLLALSSQAVGQAPPGAVWQVSITGAIGPATADHMIRSLATANTAGASLVLLQIDTPGGLDTAMRDMIKAVLASPIPVIGYVAPSGSRAASAGTYILYATHIAAMAPGTNLGAATPVQIGSPGVPSLPRGDAPEESPDGDAAPGPEAHQPGTAMEHKIINDAVAYLRGLAELRGRNAEWAERAVREGASLTASAALEQGVIDLVSTSREELLATVHGRTVQLGDHSATLDTETATVYEHPMDWRSEFLAVITNPNIAYLLMLAGIYGLLIEFYNPGVGLPGVVGAVSLLLAMYAFQVLPISYAGLGLILLGIALMAAEAFAPSFGILGLGGIVAFVFGSIMLMDTQLPAYQIAMPMIVAITVFSAALLIFALGMLARSRRRALVSGAEHLLGQRAVVQRCQGDEVYVWLEGELWQANCNSALAVEDEVEVTALHGLTLEVRKLEGSASDD